MLKVHLPNIVPGQRWYINDWDVLIRVNPIHLSYLTVVNPCLICLELPLDCWFSVMEYVNEEGQLSQALAYLVG